MKKMIISRVSNKITRLINQCHAYDFPSDNGEWTKSVYNPVLKSSDGGSLFDPFVRWVDDRFLMCVSRRMNHTIEFHESVDGVLWSDGWTVLSGVAGSNWEEKVNRGCFVLRDDVWYLFYTGQSGGKSCIGLALSDDDRQYFRRIVANPIVVPEEGFEGGSVMNPCVLWDQERELFRMWYAAGEDYEPDVVCYAESRDGIAWTKRREPIMQADSTKLYQKAKVGACDIMRCNDGSFCMAYIAYQNVNVARIALAYSMDGISNWQYEPTNPILVPERGAWDAHSVYKPSICKNPESGEWMIWYNGRAKHCEQIGLATKKQIDSLHK